MRTSTAAALMAGVMGAVLAIWMGLLSGLLLSQVALYRDVRMRFKSVAGVVDRSEVVGEVGTGNDDHEMIFYHPSVHYRYQVGEEPLSSDRINFDTSRDGDDHYARMVVGRYPVGARVVVYYDPDTPSSSVLETEVPPPTIFPLGVLRPFLVAGLLLLYASLWLSTSARRARRFVNAAEGEPGQIPGWGRWRRIPEGVTITHRASLVFSAVMPFILLAFASLPVVSSTDYSRRAHADQVGLVTSVGLSVLTGWLFRSYVRSTVTFDRVKRTVLIARGWKRACLPWDDIESVTVGWPETVRRGSLERTVSIRDGRGKTHVLHTFSLLEESLPVARKSARLVAALVGKPFDEGMIFNRKPEPT